MEYKIINSTLDLPTFDKSLPVFCDIETDGLYGPLRMIQMYQPSTDPMIYILDIAPSGYDKDTYNRELLNIEDGLMRLHTVWYNSSYDLGTLNISPSMGIKHPNEVTRNTKYTHRVDDLFYVVRTAYAEFMEFGLKKIVKKLRYTKGLYDGINTDDNPKGFIRGSYISKNAFRYAATDVLALSLIWGDKKIQLVIENNLAYKVDMMSQAYALIYQQNGLVLEREMWEKELDNSKKDNITYTNLLPKDINPNSYKQVRAHLGIEKSDVNALIEYSLSSNNNAKDAEYIIKLKRAKKQISYLSNIEFDKMFTKFNIAGAITGRFTSSGGDLSDHFNAQQIPRNFQYLFNCPTDTTSTVHADYATLELRLAASIYNEPSMYKQLIEGRDLHTDMAITISGKELHKDGLVDEGGVLNDFSTSRYITIGDRTRAKGANFGFVFGMSAKAFVIYAYTSYGIKYTLQEAITIRDKYFGVYPSIAKHHRNVWNNYKSPKFFVYTALGRRIKPNLGTDGINIPVQGSGAETTKLAVHYLIKDNPNEPMLQYIYNIVHDAIYLRVPIGKEEAMGEVLERAMIKGWVEISKTSLFNFKDIPMIADVEIHRKEVK